ncbi:LOW QUALITY PROTEIN: little elongation complex subunit 1 [Drosophila serrata]|uniref:LOW QUALITY PROTEIN: little elongation complex subunit 1 n=1 Tax=Drosophila serrata TaxID=7274 RepID=UPI000A1D1AAA|nr:LOW QUALITY PROTEIN: little elongation complex subunit 1 [Drosophila serrata]
MDLSEFPDIDIDHLLDATTALEDSFLTPYKQVSIPKVNTRIREKRIRLAERITQGDELIRQVKQLQVQNKQLADLQRTAQEVTDLYQKEKQQRLELQKQSQQLGERFAELEKEFDAQVIQCENLQENLETRALPVDAKEVLGILLQLEQRLGDDAGLVRRDQNIVKKLKDYCKTVNISIPTPKSPSPRNKRRSQASQTDTEPVPEKPTLCSVAVQVENLKQTRDQGTQHKNTTTTRGTTTASFIKKHDVGTSFPEPKPLPNVRQILDEMLSWRDEPLRPLSPLCDLLPEMENIPATVSVATCTTLCNIHREIDFMSELPPQIKVSASRPPSRTMLDNVKEEARSSRELAKELLNFLPQNQTCLANLPPQAFEELWQVFGQMVLGLLQRRSTPPTVSQADFTNWLYELYEGTQGQPVQTASKDASQKDFSGSTECMDVGTDPIIASPNISHGGDVTPIRLPAKPRERRHKSKKRKAAASTKKPIAKRTCQEMEPAEDNSESTQKSKSLEQEQEPETAIQFLSNLNTFNMANCDNLDMELDEEEMYLLQLTSKPTVQEEQEQAQEAECVSQFLPLPEDQESQSSLKDDIELEHTENAENPEIPDGITCKEKDSENRSTLPDLFQEKARETENITYLPDLCPDEVHPSAAPLNSAGMQLDQNEEKANITNLIDAPPTVTDTTFNDSDSGKESNLSEKQLAIEEIDSFKELLVEPASTGTTLKEADHYLYSSDSDSEDNTIQSVKGTTLNISTPASPLKAKWIICPTFLAVTLIWNPKQAKTSYLKKTLRWSQLKRRKRQPQVMLNPVPKSSLRKKPNEVSKNREECNTSGSVSSELNTVDSEEDLNESESETSNQQEETKSSSIASECEIYDNEAGSCRKLLCKETELESTDLVPSLPNLIEDSTSDLENNVKLIHTQLTSPTLSSSDDSEDDSKLIIDVEMPPSIVLPLASPKRSRTVSEFRSPTPTQGEGRLTRQRAKQLLLEQHPSTENAKPLIEEIRRQLKQAQNKSEICNPAPVTSAEQYRKNPEDLQPDQSYKCNEESPASPRPEPMEELVDSYTEIPLEQADDMQYDGQPKSIIQHVIDHYKADPKLNQLRRKTLGKSQQRLCASIGKYLEESLALESLSLEVYKLTKEEAVIVNAMVVVVTKIGLEGKNLERLLSALNYFGFTQRFLAELEERLFRNTKERPPTELAMKYVKLYLAAVSHQASVTQEYANPARLLLAKLLYHYEQDMPRTVLAVLRHFPTVLPHREERQYDHSDPLITVLKHLLMSRTYDMQDPEGAERLLLSKLRFEYHYQPFEPNKEQVLENLVEKLKAGRSLDQLGYAFALFCRRSPQIKAVDLVVTEHLMPLATSYCDLAAAQDESYDDRLVVVLQCISMVLKPLPLETDISAFVGLVKRLIVAVPRPGVQQAAVQACLRLQRFGFQTIRDALQNYRPNYPLDPLTRSMLRCFAERRKRYHIIAPKGKAART